MRFGSPRFLDASLPSAADEKKRAKTLCPFEGGINIALRNMQRLSFTATANKRALISTCARLDRRRKRTAITIAMM